MNKRNNDDQARLKWFGILVMAMFSLVRPIEALTINVTYDSSVTHLTNASQVEAAFAAAAQVFENQFTNAITINITVYWGNTGPFTGGIGLGASYTHYLGTYSYPELTNALHSARTSTADNSSVASLPSNDPIASNQWWVPLAQVKVLGLVGIGPNDPGEDGAVGFASTNTISYTFDPTNRAVAGKFDFIGVAEHEISEVLGRNAGLDYPADSGYVPYDLFRFTSVGTRNFDPFGMGVYFSVDNGATALAHFYTNITMGDVQDWQSSSPPDAFDAFVPRGYQLLLSAADITALDILGYNSAGTTGTAPLLTGVLLGNGTFRITFTNTPDATFTVLSATNLTVTVTNWTVLGVATQVSSGQFQFTDGPATNQLRFYKVRTP